MGCLHLTRCYLQHEHGSGTRARRDFFLECVPTPKFGAETHVTSAPQSEEIPTGRDAFPATLIHHTKCKSEPSFFPVKTPPGKRAFPLFLSFLCFLRSPLLRRFLSLCVLPHAFTIWVILLTAFNQSKLAVMVHICINIIPRKTCTDKLEIRYRDYTAENENFQLNTSLSGVFKKNTK